MTLSAVDKINSPRLDLPQLRQDRSGDVRARAAPRRGDRDALLRGAEARDDAQRADVREPIHPRPDSHERALWLARGAAVELRTAGGGVDRDADRVAALERREGFRFGETFCGASSAYAIEF